ncbi:PREDICTED: protein CURVATURE THYLAKOID 1D, chloroplastic [Populus euphratica]|uniref:Protein CURVATURE THYLAKOID 1D, chloroplastic n=1 Tax=Populus euphratica TaxID=75702 RepID=A0AAJ6TIS5_POPEU|nr:PREDICTED: protein CURVATURE THYLAKOID 1D, chloroplastic [Populus euphratica]
MELCSTTPCTSNHPKIPYHFRPKTSLTLQKTLISPTSSRRLYSRIRATFSEEPNQYVKEDRNGAVAVEESPALTETETEEATAAQVSDEFLFKLFDPEDAFSVLFYASGALVAFWLVVAVVGAVDSIPLFPKLMEVVGFGYTTWFATRYLLFKKNRDELAAEVAEFKQQVLGSDDD